MPKDVSVTEARALQEQGHTYLDVRSSPEFAAGHPAGAVNVPLLEPDEDTGQMMPNPDFVRVVQANFPTGTRLLVGCLAGGRSMRAARMLESFGYEDVTNVEGGFGGAQNPMGQPASPGWVESGLPVEEGEPEDRSFRHLLARADQDS